MPMRFTAEDIRRQLASTPDADISQQTDLSIQNLISSMATAAQNSILEGCPVLIERLRSSPRLAQQIKEIMQGWLKVSLSIMKTLFLKIWCLERSNLLMTSHDIW